jgi:hypothetical protein
MWNSTTALERVLTPFYEAAVGRLRVLSFSRDLCKRHASVKASQTTDDPGNRE